MKRAVRLGICMAAVLLVSCSQKREPKEMFPVAKNIRTMPFGNFSAAFNDMNETHLSAATRLGIAPARSRNEVLALEGRLCRIEENDYYAVDSLTHSMPFLVPVARNLLDTIGKNFSDSLRSRGGDSYKIIVTSVLRTESDISGLQQGNVNASSNSAHRYGTTFDITYVRFQRTNNRYTVPDAQLKHLLGEVLLALRRQGRCYVRYELKQGCFHITAR